MTPKGSRPVLRGLVGSNAHPATQLIDFLAVLFGYAISGERTLEEFYQRLQPFAVPFMALFERDQIPARSTLSRFLAALTEEPIEALRTLFLDDLLARPLTHDKQRGGLVDRNGHTWVVFDVDGTRKAARQRALPQGDNLPPAFRRLDDVCAPGYRGRKRGEVVRTRTTVAQAHSYQWLGSYGNRGNGRYREELRKGLAAIGRYLTAHHLPQGRARLASRRAIWQRGGARRCGWLRVCDPWQRLSPARSSADSGASAPASRPISAASAIRQMERSLYDCPQIPVGPEGMSCRVIVATHPARKKKSPIGVTRAGVVYELFFTNLPQHACTACDVVELYLPRGAFEPMLSDEDREQDPDRWCSHVAWGQECWQLVSQWVWNLRLELGHQLKPQPLRTTEFAPALPPPPPHTAPASGYAPPEVGSAWKAGRFAGRDFTLQPDGTFRCPANQELRVQKQRREADGSLRVVYAASMRSCRPCPLRAQCQWQGSATKKPRQVSVLLHPLVVGPALLLWQDWSRRVHRCACQHLVRDQRVEVNLPPPPPVEARPIMADVILSRAQRTHTRLAWETRLARNARPEALGQLTIKVFGVPEGLATFLGLAIASRSPAC